MFEAECYNPLNNEWISCPSLSERKGCLASASLNDKIYALGGGNGTYCFKEVEMLDPVLGRWIPVQSMQQKVISLLFWSSTVIWVTEMC